MEEKRKKEPRPLDPVYQDAEDSFNAKLLIIERATKKSGGNPACRKVLSWFFGTGADHHPVVSRPRDIGRFPGIDLKERSVQQANAHWRRLGALRFEERFDENGAYLPPWASLNWDAVLSLACTDRSSAVLRSATREPVTMAARNQEGCERSFSSQSFPLSGSVPKMENFLTDGANGETRFAPPPGAFAPPPGAFAPPPGANAPPPCTRPYTAGGSIPLGWRSPRELLACARRAVSSELNTELSAVDDSSVQKRGSKGEISALAALAGKTIFPGGVPIAAWRTFYAAAAAAKLLMGDPWLSRSAEETLAASKRPRGVDDRLRFLAGTLRVNAARIANVGPFSDREEGRDWLGQFLQPFELATQAWLPEPPAQDAQKAPAPPPDATKVHEEDVEVKRRLVARLNAGEALTPLQLRFARQYALELQEAPR